MEINRHSGAGVCSEMETELGKGLEHESCMKQLRKLGVFNLQKRSTGGALLFSTVNFKEVVARWGQPLFPRNK